MNMDIFPSYLRNSDIQSTTGNFKHNKIVESP